MASHGDTCEYCAADLTLEERPVTVYRHRGAQHFIFEQVPARVCPRCGERYFSAQVARKMQQQMKKPASKVDVVPVPIISFA